MIDAKYYKEALLIRRVEEKLLELFSQGKLNGTVHTCVGQEFSAVAFAGQLEKDDFIFSNHRCHGHFISFTEEVEGLIAEIMGKGSGVCGGVGGSQHLCHKNFYSNGIQGGIVPVAAGLALANKLQKNGNIGVVFIGDGTLGQGVVYETMNIVSNWEIPLLIVCENNMYAQSTSSDLTIAGEIKKRAEAFNIMVFESKTADPDSIIKNAKKSIDYVRKNNRPAFHLVETYRLNAHSKGDDFRDKSEVARFKEMDPLNVFARENNVVYEKFLAEIDLLIDEAVNKHLDSEELAMDEYYLGPRPKAESDAKWLPLEIIEKRQAELINQYFINAMGRSKEILFIGEDVLSPYGGAFKVANQLSILYPDRVFSTPISEAAISGIENGLALGGFRPFLEIMFGDFITLCMDQIINHASKFCNMYKNRVNCPLVIRTPMGGRRGYGPTHSQTLDKFLVGIDGVITVALNTLIDPGLIYESILRLEKHPVIVVENKADYTKKIAANRLDHYRYEMTDTDYPVVRITPNSVAPNITLVTYGGMSDIVIDSIEKLFDELDLVAEVLVLSMISPLDLDVVYESIRRTGKLFVIEEGSSFSGIGSELLASVLEKLGGNIIAGRISALPVPIPSARSLENQVLPGVNAIIDKIKEKVV